MGRIKQYSKKQHNKKKHQKKTKKGADDQMDLSQDSIVDPSKSSTAALSVGKQKQIFKKQKAKSIK